MELYNRELQRIENKEKEKKILEIAEREIDFLIKKYGVDEKLLKERLDKLSVVECSGKTHFAIDNGKKKEMKNPDAAAFARAQEYKYNEEKCELKYGIYIYEGNDNHNIEHEMFHYFSANTVTEYDENDIGYNKQGVFIRAHNRKIEGIDVGLNACGLNEGITEMLAMQVDGMSAPNIYGAQVYLAQILVNDEHYSLIDAYFSKEPEKFKEFLSEFDKRQSVISSKDLVNMSTNGTELITPNLFRGCLRYSFSYCKNLDELIAERKRLIPILKNIRSDNYIDFSDEEFELKDVFEKEYLDKKIEIEKSQTKEDVFRKGLDSGLSLEQQAENVKLAQEKIEEKEDKQQGKIIE